jgi:hypothetical protein
MVIDGFIYFSFFGCWRLLVEALKLIKLPDRFTGQINFAICLILFAVEFQAKAANFEKNKRPPPIWEAARLCGRGLTSFRAFADALTCGVSQPQTALRRDEGPRV